jgi:phytoene/squalene synthetase
LALTSAICFPCNDEWELHYSGSAIKKQEGDRPYLRTVTSTIGRQGKGEVMLRAILTATAVLCMSQAAFAQEMTAEQRSACMGDYEKYCKGVAPGGGRIIACLAKESDKITPACKKVLAAAEKK